MKKRLVSLLLFFVLILQNVPVQVLADHRSVVAPIVLGDFSVAGVGTNRLVSGTTLLSQNTLMAVPYPGAELTLTVKDGYQVRVHSGNNANRIDQTSAWLGADNDGTDTYTYSLPTASIYMRVSLRRSDGAAMTLADLSLSGLAMTYESTSDIVEDNAHTAQILSDTDLPVLLHISDIHGDTIRAGRAAQFASAVGADALLASGDLTAYDPDDWGSALFDTMAQYPDVNFVYGIGNHDAKIAASTYQETIYNSYFSHNPATPDGETYYYKDLPDQKLRLISVNQQEGASTTTSGGTCYSQAQVDWLVETLKSTPAGYGVVLMYHSPETTIAAAGDPNYSEFFQTGNRYDNPTNSYSGYSGTFLMDLIDAFMLRKNFSWNYSEKNGASPVTLNADFTGVAEGVEFIAHLTGHVHSDSITYLPGTACKQLLLGVTCTTSMYGEEGGYYGLADYSDLIRQADTANQDAFNAYVIDRENKTVRVLRIGAQQTVSGTTRDDMTIPYSVPFEEGEYPFNTEGLVKLDLSNVEWVNYGIQEYGVEPTYKPGVRYSTNAIFDVPYEGVTFYIKINAPYELGIRSGETDTTMSTNYYWLNNKSLTSGNQNRGYIYTIPAGHEKFILSLANVTRDGSNNVTNTNHPISFMELQAAGVEIWYRPEPTLEPGYPFGTEDKVKLDLNNVEWVNYGYQPYGPEPTYHVGTRLTTNMIFDIPYEGVTFYIKINAPYELGIRSGETDTAMNTNLGWLNNKFLSSGDNNYGYLYTIPEGHKKFILTIGNVPRNSANNVSNWYKPIDLEELEAAGLEIWYVPCNHSFENGICTICGENAPSEPMTLRYDDRYDITGKTVEIVDAGTPTSFKVGYGVVEGTLDDAVITLDGNKLIATGIGTAQVKIDGILYEITVEAAPISLLLLAGQSNMQGIDGDPNQSVICPDGMVYATYADRYKKTVEDVTKFAPSALTGAYASINVTGDTACLENYPVHMLTESGSGREGMDSGLAYEWVRQTGEKVWVINLGYGGSSINGWLEGGEHYLACQELLSACQQTLRQEIAAGHYTLSHMGYFWCQGCADETQTAQWYAEKFQTMHQLFKTELTFDHDSDPATAEKSMEFGAIIPIRAGHSWMGSYRAGAYTHSTNVPYYQSFLDLRFNGPRVAQYWMGNNPDLPDIWNVCTIQEGWATLPDGTDGVAEYFRSAYENGTVDYPVQVRQTTSWYTPTTPADVHDNIHYNQIGYNEIGRESARNALILLGETEAPNVETTVEFMTWDGFTPADSITASTAGHSGTLVVPMVYPVWRSKEVTYSVSNGLRYDYYDLLTDNVFTSGTLTANGAVGTVSVAPKSLTNYHWIFKDSALVPSTENGQTSNPLTLLSGTITDGQFKSVRYQTAESILLLHDETWALEIQISDWTATTGSMLLSGGTNSADGQPYLYFRPADYFVGFGYYDGTQYRNHGVSLKAYGISCGTGTHTYRFVNHIAEDGTNMVWLYVDDTQIAPLTDLYLNSTLAQSENTWISGQDFVLPYLGASNIPITGMKIDSIWVLETGYDSNIHIHTWSDWQTVTTPSIDGPGIDQRTCTGCSETQTREVNGVWQTHDLATYLTPLPDHLCGGLDLWDILPHNTYYYHSGTHWGIHESGSVYSVTIPVSEGDRIWATSFGKYGENGNNIGTGAHGIRVTFFDIHGVCKTLTPQQTYAEFSANGYLTVPEGAIAMNIPMYSDSNDNALYILNCPHTPSEAVKENEGPHGSHDRVTYCSICGEELSREHDDGYLPGDINGDGAVNNKDVTRLFQYLSDYDVEVVEEAMDVNGDGSVNNKDLTRLFQYLSDYEVELH